MYELNDLNVLAINSNYFTEENQNDKAEALKQLDFINESIKNSQKKIIIFMHVPFGINFNKYVEVFWIDQYLMYKIILYIILIIINFTLNM